MSSKEKTKSIINKLTTDDRNPPSGYLLQELAKRTTAMPECQLIEDLISKKLSKSKPYIKYKSLRVIKYLCENGSQSWRRSWQRQINKLRECKNFSGAPDPIYGDTLYQQVRTAAIEAMQSVFHSQQKQIDITRISHLDSTSVSTASFESGRIGIFSNAQNRRMPPSSNPWNTNSNVNGIRPMIGYGSDSSYKPKKPAQFTAMNSNLSYANPMSFTDDNLHSRGSLDNRGSGSKRKKGKVGGAWGKTDTDSNEEESDESNDVQEHEQNRYQSGFIGGNVSTKHDGLFEQSWINKIIKAGGVGCKIPDMHKHIQQFENLSKKHALEYLDNKLIENNWQLQAKALTLILGLLSGPSADEVMEYFKHSSVNILNMKNANKSQLRKNANRLSDMLGLSVDDEKDYSTSTNTVEVQESIDNIGNFLDIGGNTPPPAIKEENEHANLFADITTNSAVNEEIDIFNELDVKSAVKSSANDFSFLEELAVNQSVKQTDGTSDLNDILYAAVEKTQPVSSAFDLDLNVNKSGNDSVFGFSMDTNAPAVQNTSSFGFMNNSNTKQMTPPMITPQLMNHSQQNMQYMHNLMQQMSQMNVNLNVRNNNNMQYQTQHLQQFQQQNMQQFQKNMQKITKNYSSYGSNANDPFANIINQSTSHSSVPTVPRNTKPKKDPFAEFSINALQ